MYVRHNLPSLPLLKPVRKVWLINFTANQDNIQRLEANCDPYSDGVSVTNTTVLYYYLYGALLGLGKLVQCEKAYLFLE